MRLLAIETTGAAASAALIDEERLLAERISDQKMNHLQNLLPMVDELLEECGQKIGDVDGIAVSEGPGSFTGIRIGMATAKALAQVLSVPVVSVPTLQSFAWHVPDYPGIICPIFDAKRSQVYGGAYRWNGGTQPERLIEDGAYDIIEYLDFVADALSDSGELLFFGDGIAPYQEQIRMWNSSTSRRSLAGEEIVYAIHFMPEAERYQRASSVAQLGRCLWNQGEAVSLFQLKPVYLRKAEAERKLLEKQAREKAAAKDATEVSTERWK